MFSQHLLGPPGSIPPPEPIKKTRLERPKPAMPPIVLPRLPEGEHQERVAELIMNYESPDELINVKEIQLTERSLQGPTMIADESEQIQALRQSIGVESGE